MTDALYHLIAILLAVVAVARGYRHGFTGQISKVLGMSFGIVVARVAGPQLVDVVYGASPEWLLVGEGAPYAVAMGCHGAVYLAVCALMRVLTGVLRSAMQLFSTGMLNSLLGAAFCLLRYMIVLSIAYNLMADFQPRGQLMKFATDHDGNVVEGVMDLAPMLLGCPGCEDLAHEVQLIDARRIS